jgi:hypothetical protein
MWRRRTNTYIQDTPPRRRNAGKHRFTKRSESRFITDVRGASACSELTRSRRRGWTAWPRCLEAGHSLPYSAFICALLSSSLLYDPSLASIHDIDGHRDAKETVTCRSRASEMKQRGHFRDGSRAKMNFVGGTRSCGVIDNDCNHVSCIKVLIICEQNDSCGYTGSSRTRVEIA